MAAGAYSIAAPSPLARGTLPGAPVAGHVTASLGGAGLRSAGLQPVHRASVPPPGRAAANPVSDAPVLPGLPMLVASALWILVLVRRRWPTNG